MSADAPQLPGSSRTLRAVAIIPARLGSTRLPRKMLLRETGMYLFEHTARNLTDGGAVERVVVATDSEELLAAAREVGVEALLTSRDHQSGTDRVNEAHAQLVQSGAGPFQVVVNVQGDEPDVAAADVAHLIDAFRDEDVEMATLWTDFEPGEEVGESSSVKVVLDARDDALYFSRAPIPDLSHARPDASGELGSAALKRHIGVYAFRPAALARFCSLPIGTLERHESLEQLRWLEAGGRLRVLQAAHRPIGIDTAEDYSAYVIRHSLARGKPGALS